MNRTRGRADKRLYKQTNIKLTLSGGIISNPVWVLLLDKRLYKPMPLLLSERGLII